MFGNVYSLGEAVKRTGIFKLIVFVGYGLCLDISIFTSLSFVMIFTATRICLFRSSLHQHFVNRERHFKSSKSTGHRGPHSRKRKDRNSDSGEISGTEKVDLTYNREAKTAVAVLKRADGSEKELGIFCDVLPLRRAGRLCARIALLAIQRNLSRHNGATEIPGNQ